MTSRYQTPYDIYLTVSSEKVGFKLAKDDAGKVIYRSGVAPFSAAQISTGRFSLESVNSNIDVPMSFQNWRGGAGFVEADLTKSLNDEVYNYSRILDLSWPNRGYIAPQPQTGGTVETTNPNGFVYSSLGLFTWNDRYLYEWTGSAWTERKDVGASETINDVFEYRNSTATYIVIGVTTEGYYYSTNGTSFTQVNTTQVAPSFRANTSTSANAVTSISRPAPAGTVVDDVMFAVVSIDIAETITAPAGWTTLVQDSFGATRQWLGYKRFANAEEASYIWSWTSAAEAVVGIVSYQNVLASGTPYDTAGYELQSGATPVSSSTGEALGTLRTSLVMAVGTAGAVALPTGAVPAGFAERLDTGSTASSTTRWVYAMDDVTVTKGALVAQDITVTNPITGQVLAALIVVKPKDVGPKGVVRWAVRGSGTGEPLLWALDVNGDFRNSPDPTTESTWSQPDSLTLGEANVTVSGLQVMGNEFFLVNEKGISTYDGINVGTSWLAGTLELESNAARAYVWVDRKLYFTFSGALFSFEKDTNDIVRVWPRGGQVGNSEINGTITAIAGDSRNLYFSVKNAAGNYYTMKGDPTQPLTINGETVFPFHTLIWHSNRAVEALIVVPGASDTLHSTNPQLVIGDITSADYYILPRPGMRPEDDSNYRFHTDEGTAYGSWVDAGARTYNKWLNHGRTITEGISASTPATYIALNYEIDASGSEVQIHQVATSGVTTTDVTSSEVSFGRIRYSVDMDTDTNTGAPRLIGLTLNATMNPTRKRQWEIAVEIANAQPQVGSAAPTRYQVDDLEDFLFSTLTNRVTFNDHRGTQFFVHAIDVQGLDRAADLNGSRGYAITLVEL